VGRQGSVKGGIVGFGLGLVGSRNGSSDPASMLAEYVPPSQSVAQLAFYRYTVSKRTLGQKGRMNMATYVYPNCEAVVNWQGSRVRINQTQAWRADDPFVKARPELFSPDPVRVSSSVPETATARPGETRDLPPRKPRVRKADPPRD